MHFSQSKMHSYLIEDCFSYRENIAKVKFLIQMYICLSELALGK